MSREIPAFDAANNVALIPTSAVGAAASIPAFSPTFRTTGRTSYCVSSGTAYTTLRLQGSWDNGANWLNLDEIDAGFAIDVTVTPTGLMFRPFQFDVPLIRGVSTGGDGTSHWNFYFV